MDHIRVPQVSSNPEYRDLVGNLIPPPRQFDVRRVEERRTTGSDDGLVPQGSLPRRQARGDVRHVVNVNDPHGRPSIPFRGLRFPLTEATNRAALLARPVPDGEEVPDDPHLADYPDGPYPQSVLLEHRLGGDFLADPREHEPARPPLSVPSVGGRLGGAIHGRRPPPPLPHLRRHHPVHRVRLRSRLQAVAGADRDRDGPESVRGRPTPPEGDPIVAALLPPAREGIVQGLSGSRAEEDDRPRRNVDRHREDDGKVTERRWSRRSR